MSGIKSLIALRQQTGIKASSDIRILKAEKDSYIADIFGDRALVRCKLGPCRKMGRWEPEEEDGWEKAIKGKNICVWLRTA